MSSDSKHSNLGCGKRAKAAIRGQADALYDLGAVDQSFTWTEVREIGAVRAIKKVKNTQALIETEREDGLLVCRLSANAQDYLRDLLETRETFMPCGHGGVRKTANGYVCLYEGCDRVAERSEVEI